MVRYKIAAWLLFIAGASTLQLVLHAQRAHAPVFPPHVTVPLHLLQHGHAAASTAAWQAETPASSSDCQANKLHLGFDYPELRPLKRSLSDLLCSPPSLVEIAAAYAHHFGLHTTCPAPPLEADHNLHRFLTAAQQLLSTHSLRDCGQDPSLLAALDLQQCHQQPGSQPLHATQPASIVSANASTSQPRTGVLHASNALRRHTVPGTQPPGQPHPKYLLAANLHNSGHLLPNLILQTLQLAVLLPNGTLAVSLYESGSSDLTPYWINLLRLLLLPLGIPHHFVTGGSLKPTKGLPRIQLLAALRNAALEPVTRHTQQLQDQQPAASHGHHPHQQQRGASRGLPPPLATRGRPVQLTFRMQGFTPDYIAFANDVLLCAVDVLRLAAHKADLSCGMDFYLGHWEATSHNHWHNPQQQQQQPPATAGSAAPPGAQQQQLRFYDKWVARDIAGGLLSNVPPYLLHHRTQQLLLRGAPVPMYCCWNGLALLRAAPLLSGNLSFRSHRRGECRASECSLLCDDMHRAGLHHVVMDPGVQLAYDPEQLGLLGQRVRQQRRSGQRRLSVQGAGVSEGLHGPARPTADASEQQGSAGGSSSGDVDLARTKMPGTAAGQQHAGASSSATLAGMHLPRLEWSQVAASAAAAKQQCSQAAAAALAAHQAAAAADPAAAAPRPVAGADWRQVQCCDLQQGLNYVNFAADCHPASVLAMRAHARMDAP